MGFLEDSDFSPRTWRGESREERGRYWTGQGRDALEVAYAAFDARPTVAEVRKLWAERHKRRAAPLLLVAAHPKGALLCGPLGEDPRVVERDLGQAERLAAAALNEPNRHFAIQKLASALEVEPEDILGLHNQGLLASHELHVGVPERPDWTEATERAQPLLGLCDRRLMEGLGFAIKDEQKHSVLRLGVEGNARAVAVFLNENEQPDLPAERYDRQSPVTYALTQAERANLPWVIAVRGSALRLYSTTTSGAVGQRSRSETFVGLDLSLLPTAAAGYLHLLFSAAALAEGGTFQEVAEASQNFAAGLSERLRERVYTQVVPRLARAVANRQGAVSETKSDLDMHYRVAVTTLFRLLFIAYAEDSKLLPLKSNEDYAHHALKTAARGLARAINNSEDLGFDNPLTDVIEPDTDTESTDLWDRARNLFIAIDKGREPWGVPVYNGGLFSADGNVNPVGPTIEELRLTNAEFGPALVALTIDRTPDGIVGPIDFRSLSVREFGTIYEGLLESELARTDEDLTLRKDSKLGEVYVPATANDTIVIPAGGVYLHNKSGARKTSGSYFTKPLAVKHLIDTAVLPALDKHLERVARLLDTGDEATAAETLFDFRVADIAMGSGHFLTAVVDAAEARYSTFLAEHPIPHVTKMLESLRQAAHENLGALAEVDDIETAALLRRMIARKCVYGVDINPVSVELARVSMWIHTFVRGLPLSFLDHNLIVGDSLTGIATVQEAMEELTESGFQMGLFDDPVRRALSAAEGPLRRLSNTVDATTADIEAAREAAEEARAAVQPVTDLFDLLVAARLGEVSPPTLTALDDLPSFDVARAGEVVSQLNAVHFPVVFPEVFIRDKAGFDALIGNPPWEEPVVEELGWWAIRKPGLKALSPEEQTAAILKARHEHPDLVESFDSDREGASNLRALLGSGAFPGMGEGDPDLYKAFSWRFWHLVGEGGSVGVVLPRSAFQAKGSAPWRRAALPSATSLIVTIRNRDEWAFTDVNPGYTICLASLGECKIGSGELTLAGRYDNPDDFVAGLAAGGTELQALDLLARDEVLALPDLGTDESVSLFALLVEQPTLGGDRDDFEVYASTDFHATNDRKKTGILRPDGDTPVYNHLNIGHFAFDSAAGEFTRCNEEVALTELKRRKRANARRGNSPFSAMLSTLGSAWLEDDSTTPALQPRIAIRDVIHASNKRKVWAALLPQRTLLTNKAPFLMFARGDTDAQLYLLGMMGSSVCDWWGHLFINLGLNYFILYGLPIPEFDADDEKCQRLVQLAASLAVAGDGDYGEFAKYNKVAADRDEMTAELDALASQLYGLEDDHLPLVWNKEETGRPPLDRVRVYRQRWADV